MREHREENVKQGIAHITFLAVLKKVTGFTR
jgi:hypothetical protein